jgi:glycerol-3-phosphate O-acyltransferase
MASIKEKYGHLAKQMMENSKHTGPITSQSLFQESNTKNRELVEQVLYDLVLPESSIQGYEHLQALTDHVSRGGSGLVLMEHFSNFDIPCLDYLLRYRYADGRRIADSIVSLAGMKLNVESQFVHAFTEAYTRIVIYPRRSVESIADPVERAHEEQRAKEINHSALREMIRCKHTGRIILVFPTGTRYRPGNPDTRRVLRTVDSYIKSFDYLVFIGIAGNVLLVSESGDMTEDLVQEDVMTYQVSELVDCKAFRNEVRAEVGEEGDLKDRVATKVREELDRAHENAERHRQKLLAARRPE